tara:strand:+ start:33 stop:1181 length:1149 start_codon:yes stop_codon:yes gene_type:complete
VVFGNLVENRICYKGDGGGDTGSGADSPAPVTNPGSRERGRGAEPAAATGRNFRQATRDDRDPGQDALVNIVTSTVANPMGDSTRADPGNIIAARTTQRDEDEIQRFVESMPTGPSTAAPIPAMPQERAANNQAELVRQLVTNAAQQSLDQGGATEPVSAVMGPAGRQDPGSGFFADAYDALYGTPDPNDDPVTAPGTALGTILGAGPVSGLFGGNTPDPADAAAFNVGQLERMGGVRDPQTGAITGATAGPGTLNMNRFGMVTYSGVNDPNYTGAFQNLVRGTAGLNGTENDRPSDNQMAMRPAAPAEPMDPGTTTPEQIDDLAVNYLQNPFYLYSGQGNLFQPYGYAGNTLVDLLQTRNMQMPGQAAPNLGLFGNPRDFS